MYTVFSAIDEPPKETPQLPPTHKPASPLVRPGASSATESRSRSTGRRSSSSRVMLVADSVEATSTMVTMRELLTSMVSRLIEPRVTFAVVAVPRPTVTSASLPRVAPFLVASTTYRPTGRNGNR